MGQLVDECIVQDPNICPSEEKVVLLRPRAPVIEVGRTGDSIETPLEGMSTEQGSHPN